MAYWNNQHREAELEPLYYSQAVSDEYKLPEEYYSKIILPSIDESF